MTTLSWGVGGGGGSSGNSQSNPFCLPTTVSIIIAQAGKSSTAYIQVLFFCVNCSIITVVSMYVTTKYGI